jgi:hypothetical protein
MTETWLLAALWLGLALVATLLSIWLRVATALSEIVVGTVAQLIIGATLGTALLHTDDSWTSLVYADLRIAGGSPNSRNCECGTLAGTRPALLS